jgi:hypothetical protein
MGNGSNLSREYTFATPIDLPAILEGLGTQYLDVNETRALVIFNTAILNLESIQGNLTSLKCVEIEVYELPYNTASEEAENGACRVLDSFISQLTQAEVQVVSDRK